MARARAPRLDPEVRRRQLLDVALQVATEQDFASLTVDAVAKAADVTRPVVYDALGSFAGMLEALLDDAEAQALQAVGDALPDLSGDPDPAQVIEQALLTFMHAVKAQPRLWRLLLSPPEGAPAEIRERYREQRALVVEHVSGLVGWFAQQSPELKDVDTRILARTLIAVVEDAARLSLEHPRKYPADRLAATAAQLVRLVPLGR